MQLPGPLGLPPSRHERPRPLERRTQGLPRHQEELPGLLPGLPRLRARPWSGGDVAGGGEEGPLLPEIRLAKDEAGGQVV